MEKEIRKKFFLFEIIASELVALNCLYYADIASHRLSICEQTTLVFFVSLKGTFPIATTFTVINKYSKGAVIQIATVFRYICHVVCRKVL